MKNMNMLTKKSNEPLMNATSFGATADTISFMLPPPIAISVSTSTLPTHATTVCFICSGSMVLSFICDMYAPIKSPVRANSAITGGKIRASNAMTISSTDTRVSRMLSGRFFTLHLYWKNFMSGYIR